MNDMVKNILLWVVIAVVLMSVFNSFGPRAAPSAQVGYSQFLDEVKQGRIAHVSIDGRTIQGRTSSGEKFTTYSPESQNTAMIGELLKNGVEIEGTPPEQQSLLMQIFISWFPMLLLIGIWIFFLRQMQGGGGGRGAMSFGKSRARMMSEDQIKITFADVAGVEEAKEEVAELVEFLRDPGKFQKLGGKIPRGVLMVGSPGTGKTLLAKAIAGEAKVPFFTISGSDFVEMFVGVGASRVRDMFEQAKKHAPCIIFIDEIDAVGRHRGAGLGGGHDEREQTLNQLLVEMDGFEGNEGIFRHGRPERIALLSRDGNDRFRRMSGQFLLNASELPIGLRRAAFKCQAEDVPVDRQVDLGLPLDLAGGARIERLDGHRSRLGGRQRVERRVEGCRFGIGRPETRPRRGDGTHFERQLRHDGQCPDRSHQELAQIVAGDVFHDAASRGKQAPLTVDRRDADDEVSERAVSISPRSARVAGDGSSDGGTMRLGDVDRQALPLGGQSLLQILHPDARLDGDRHVTGRVVDDPVQIVQVQSDVAVDAGIAVMQGRPASDRKERPSLAVCVLCDETGKLLSRRRREHVGGVRVGHVRIVAESHGIPSDHGGPSMPRAGSRQVARLFQVAALDRLVPADDVGPLSRSLFVKAVPGFDVFGESELVQLLVVLHPLVHRRLRPVPADEDRLNDAANRRSRLGMLAQRRIGDRLDHLELFPGLAVRQDDLVDVRRHLWNSSVSEKSGLQVIIPCTLAAAHVGVRPGQQHGDDSISAADTSSPACQAVRLDWRISIHRPIESGAARR